MLESKSDPRLLQEWSLHDLILSGFVFQTRGGQGALVFGKTLQVQGVLKRCLRTWIKWSLWNFAMRELSTEREEWQRERLKAPLPTDDSVEIIRKPLSYRSACQRRSRAPGKVSSVFDRKFQKEKAVNTWCFCLCLTPRLCVFWVNGVSLAHLLKFSARHSRLPTWASSQSILTQLQLHCLELAFESKEKTDHSTVS